MSPSEIQTRRLGGIPSAPTTRCLDCRAELTAEDIAARLDICVECDDAEVMGRETWDDESGAEPIDARDA